MDMKDECIFKILIIKYIYIICQWDTCFSVNIIIVTLLGIFPPYSIRILHTHLPKRTNKGESPSYVTNIFIAYDC